MIHDLTKKNHSEIVEQATKPVIIKVYAPWCGPCVQAKPIFVKLAEELSNLYTFAQLNVDEERDLAIKYGVTSIPCFIFIRNNTVLAQEVGFLSRDELSAKIQQYCGTGL